MRLGPDKVTSCQYPSHTIAPVYESALPGCIELHYPDKVTFNNHLLEIVRGELVHVIRWAVEGMAAQHQDAEQEHTSIKHV